MSLTRSSSNTVDKWFDRTGEEHRDVSNDSKQAAGQSVRKTSALPGGHKCAQMLMTRRQSQEEVKRKLGCFEVWIP